MEIQRAKAIAEVAQVIVNSAKVENDYIGLTKSKGSGFIEKAEPLPLPGQMPGQPRLVKGV